MTDRRETVERAVELLVFAPLGAGVSIAEATPDFLQTLVARGRAEVERRQEQINEHVTTARSMGQVALAFGVPMLRQRLQSRLDDVRSRAASYVDDRFSGAAPPVAPAEGVYNGEAARDEVPVAVATAPSAFASSAAPDPRALPIPGYDTLSASQVVERLTGLGSDELDAVHAYEAAHRGRRTILGKIEQLAG